MIKICLLQDTSFTHADVLELIKESFRQWQENGIESSLLKLTPISFVEKTANAVVLVAIDDASDTLCGTTSCSIIRDKQGKRYAYNKYSAITSKTKHSGIGSSLLRYEKQLAIEERCSHILSDTCVLAKWSVNWHKKNGFRIVGLESFTTNDYYSYIFRLQLKKPSFWSSPLYCRLRFVFSWIKTRLMCDSRGNKTLIGRLVIRIVTFLISWNKG